jgi:putative DNA primase/helicase
MIFDSTTATDAELDAKQIETDAADDPAFQVSPPGEPMPNVRRFLADQFQHPEHVLLVHQGGQFYRWDGKCWPAVEEPILRSHLYRWFERRWYADESRKDPVKRAFAPTIRKTADLLDALRAVTIIPTLTPTPSWFGVAHTPADELVACDNGLIHWPTRTLHKHSPRFYMHHAVPFVFNPKAPPPTRWLAFLRQLWLGDTESIECLQEMFGYLLAGDTSQQKMFMLVGPKRGGKGTIGRVLTRLLGRHNVGGPKPFRAWARTSACRTSSPSRWRSFPMQGLVRSRITASSRSGCFRCPARTCRTSIASSCRPGPARCRRGSLS